MQGFRFAGVLDHECAIGDLWLQHIPCTFEEQEGIVVRGSTRIEVQRVTGTSGIIDQVLCLGFTHGYTVERHIVIYSLGVEDQAIIGNNLDARGTSGFGSRGSGSTIVRGQDQDFDALGDQGLNIRLLHGGVALAEQDFDVITGGFECFAETGFVLDPARLVLGRQNDAHAELLGSGFFCRRGRCATGGENHHRHNEQTHQTI